MASISQTSVDLRLEGPRDGLLKLIFSGQLDAATTGTVWRRAEAAVTKSKPKNVVIDMAGIDYCDGAGIALLVHLRNLQNKAGGSLQIEGLRPEFESLLQDWAQASLSGAESKHAQRREHRIEAKRPAVMQYGHRRDVDEWRHYSGDPGQPDARESPDEPHSDRQ